MIKTKNEVKINTEQNAKGEVKMTLATFADFEGWNPKVRTFSHVTLKAGEEVEFHIHQGEFESYYILSGSGVYNDNGKEVEALPGMITFTPSGEGHGIKNTGNVPLEFMALIVLD